MKKLNQFLVIVALLCSIVFPQSQIVSTTFHSNSLGREIPVQVYLPPGYSSDAAPYRLYVYLHAGIYWWIDLASLDYASTYKPAFDAAIESGEVDPMVVVFPQVRFEKAQGVYIPGDMHFWTDSERNGKYESVISIDLLQWISTQYNVSTLREERAIGGHQWGSTGAVMMAVRNSDKFSVCATHLSIPSITVFYWEGNVNSYVPMSIDYFNLPIGSTTVEQLSHLEWISAAAAFSPNLVNPTWPELMIDFPFDEQGKLIRSVMHDQWYAEHDPAIMMKNLNIYRQDVAFLNQLPELVTKSFGDITDAEWSSIGVPSTWYFWPGPLVAPNLPSQEVLNRTLRFIDQEMDRAAASPPPVFEHDMRLMLRRDQIAYFNSYVNDIGAPQVWVQNTGTATETNIAVECVLTQGSEQQRKTTMVPSLESLEAKLLTFDLRPPKNEDFEVVFTARLPNDQNSANDQATLSMTAGELLDDFEKGNQQWQTNQDWGVSSASSVSGRFCMEDVPYGMYYNNADTWAVFNSGFDISNLTDAQLVFQMKWYLQKDSDYGAVEVSIDGGNKWTILGEPFKNTNTKWHEETRSLQAYCGPGFTNVGIRFRLLTDAEKSNQGWFIDDIAIRGVGTEVEQQNEQTVSAFELFDNYPNPFNASTTITYTLATADHVTLTLYNSLGQQVTTLVDEKEQSGKHRVFWDGRDQSGRTAASGVYVYSLKAGELVQQKKMVVLK